MNSDNSPAFEPEDSFFIDHELDMMMDNELKNSKNNNGYTNLIDAISNSNNVHTDLDTEYINDFNSISSELIAGLSQRGVNLELPNNAGLLDCGQVGDERVDTLRFYANDLSFGLMYLIDCAGTDYEDELIIDGLAELMQENRLDYFTKSCFVDTLTDILGEEKINDLLLNTLSINEEVKLRNENINKIIDYNKEVNGIISDYLKEVGLPKIHDEYPGVVSSIKYFAFGILETPPPSRENVVVVFDKLKKRASLVGIDLDLIFLIDRFAAARDRLF